MSVNGQGPCGSELEELLMRTLPIYQLPGQSYWRALELAAVTAFAKTCHLERPILEIGCADGVFASKVFAHVDDAIDINARTLARARSNGLTYDRVHLMDARQMTFASGSFATVFANCVIEHIPNLSSVLASSHTMLRDGGKFVATVPLRGMNSHLSLRAKWYCDLRRRQLVHLNLFDPSEWQCLFRDAGFAGFELRPYISGGQCELWDRLDALICVGLSGRWNVGAALRLALRFYLV